MLKQYRTHQFKQTLSPGKLNYYYIKKRRKSRITFVKGILDLRFKINIKTIWNDEKQMQKMAEYQVQVKDQYGGDIKQQVWVNSLLK